MNHAATLAIPSVLATIWGIEGGLDNFRNAWILSIISIGLILIWRYFAHYVDNNIASTYIDIVSVENLLRVPHGVSIFSKIVEDSLTFDQISKLDNDQKVGFLKCLNKNKLMQPRGHDNWDKIAFWLIGLFVVVSIFAVFHPIMSKIVKMLHLHFQWTDFLVIEIEFLGFALLFGLVITVIISKIFTNYIPIQKDPKNFEIQMCYDKIITLKNCNID
jgi:hypothetical protein